MALDAALRWNAEDATAHYLLGTWYFARAMTDKALREWSTSRQMNPKIPALDASLGLAFLHEQRDFPEALSAFEDGIKNDPENIVNYSGAVATMALLGRPAHARVKTLERYPDLKQMPTSLVYDLALNRAEAGDFGGALALFHDRFFGREEGGTNVRQVWIEVKLQQLFQLGKNGHCAEVLAEARNLGLPVSGLAFTRDGLEPILNTARANYFLAEVYAACGQRTEAAAKLEQASMATEPFDLVWAWEAAKNQDGYDLTKWMNRLKAGILQAEANSRLNASQGWWIYTAGVLRIAAGQEEQGRAELREVFFLPDSRMCHHLSRLALAEAILR
jgi:tetratricopeptide (TPR) repeat protein